MMERFIYLHGFASGPNSKKARIFRDHFAVQGVPLEVPDLSGGDFFHLSVTSQLGVVRDLAGDSGVTLIGSSLGGYIAAIYAEQHPEQVRRLVLMAPAFGFARRWTESLSPLAISRWQSTGSLTVPHCGLGGTAELGWGIIEDGRRYSEEPVVVQPALIFHGLNDTVVPAGASRHFAASRPNVILHLMDSDHELLNVTGDIWSLSAAFLFSS